MPSASSSEEVRQVSLPEESDVALEAMGICKSFPGVRALDEVNLTLRRGRLTALLGENGAGKSTLMNIIAGVMAPDRGRITVRGQEVRFTSPRHALELGIAMIFQELNLLPNLTIAENIFIGREPTSALGLIDYPLMNRRAAELLGQLDLALPPTAIVGRLRVGQQQVVEIARAVSYDPAVIIMDEPTSALTEHEISVLFGLIHRLKASGVAIAYITHKFEELPRIGEDAVIMRDGRVIDAGPLANFTREQIVRLMVGREIKDLYQRTPATPGSEVFRAEHVSLRSAQRDGEFFVRDVSLAVKRGEILGIFGLMGAGRTELLETLFGLHPSDSQGELFIDGARVKIRSPEEAIAHGLALAPEDRKREGLVLSMTVAENTSLASIDRIERGWFINDAREREHVSQYATQFRVKTPSLNQLIRKLSGGNQQKVILAKWVAARPKVLLLDEPTRGIDVNAKREIYALIDELARDGLAVIVVSSELPEILAISDRIMVMCGGRKTAEFSRDEANERNIMSAALPAKL